MRAGDLPHAVLLAMLASLLQPGAALAEGRGVTVVNGGSDTVREIRIAPAGAASPGENRLRSQLPPRAQARIGYSSGCRVDVRLGFDGGRTEQFLDQDACADLRITAGAGAPGGPMPSAGHAAASHAAAKKPGKDSKAFTPAAVEVPPWTGRSITKKFGGMN